MSESKALILGYGYVGSYLKPWLEKKGHQVTTTSRQGRGDIVFSLDQPDTWKNIESFDCTFWTFPAEPASLVENFFEQTRSQLGEIVVVGSTSAFQVIESNQWIKEDSNINETIQRVVGENHLLKNGARLVHASGIYGAGRNPLDWVKSSRVGKSKKFVNMIHVLDLCQFLENAVLYGKGGERYIASDNNPLSWGEAIGLWEKMGLLQEIPLRESHRLSKRVDSSKSINDLNITLKFPNFADAVSKGLQSE